MLYLAGPSVEAPVKSLDFILSVMEVTGRFQAGLWCDMT